MATGARIILTTTGWRIKPEFQMNAVPGNPVQTRKAKQISGKIARAKFKVETHRLTTAIYD